MLTLHQQYIDWADPEKMMVLAGSILALKIWTGINTRAFFEEYG